MKRAWEITQLAFVWLLLAIGFLAVFRVWTIIARATGSTKDFWDIATAIGTCGAVVVALYVAFIGQQRQKADERIKGVLTAASVQYRLTATQRSIKIAIAKIESMVQSVALIRSQQGDEEMVREASIHASELIKSTLRAVIEVIDDMRELTFDEMHSMTGLPGDCAIQIASAQARIRSAHGILVSALGLRTTTREQMLQQVQKRLTDAAALIDNAVSICRRETKQITGFLNQNAMPDQ
ncbi:hypothetical protein [Burkholderia gladioli]|uniref:hypothetical protein n=1 Tax=Burkholderia gladioli TaxID=28095 RepID=UPI00163E2137|nr:hypothetical protein [Burkholderia gladioli]MBU9153144.1 hypothetical protein [Burkholderia gladioli]MDN7812114.1 hypothetical protein [Burkholderia gladioli]